MKKNKNSLYCFSSIPQHGSAIFVSKDGFRYTGNFKNNKYDGKGEFYLEDTGETKIVRFKNGEEITN